MNSSSPNKSVVRSTAENVVSAGKVVDEKLRESVQLVTINCFSPTVAILHSRLLILTINLPHAVWALPELSSIYFPGGYSASRN